MALRMEVSALCWVLQRADASKQTRAPRSERCWPSTSCNVSHKGSDRQADARCCHVFVSQRFLVEGQTAHAAFIPLVVGAARLRARSGSGCRGRCREKSRQPSEAHIERKPWHYGRARWSRICGPAGLPDLGRDLTHSIRATMQRPRGVGRRHASLCSRRASTDESQRLLSTRPNARAETLLPQYSTEYSVRCMRQVLSTPFVQGSFEPVRPHWTARRHLRASG